MNTELKTKLNEQLATNPETIKLSYSDYKAYQRIVAERLGGIPKPRKQKGYQYGGVAVTY